MPARELNEDRRRRFGQPARTLALLCECGDPDCRQTVLMSVEDYDSCRPDLIVHATHQDIERLGQAS